MRLVKVVLNGFRSFGEKTEINIDELTTFIGGNGVGKTTALIALNKMFSSNPADRIVKPSDFFIDPKKDEKEVRRRSLSCEAIFTMSSDYSYANCEAAVEYFSHVTVSDEGQKPYLRIRLDADWIAQGPADGTVDSRIRYVVVPFKVSKENEKFAYASRTELNSIRMIYVPAVRDPEKQLGRSSSSILMKLIHNINWQQDTIDNIKDEIAKLNNTVLGESGTKLIINAISDSWKSYYQDPRFSKVELTMNVNSINELTKKIHMSFESNVSGRQYLPEEMGDGTRSLFYISNVASVLSIESQLQKDSNQLGKDPKIYSQPPALTIVAIEEPENHISPHLLGKLIIQLKKIAKLENAQVLITSHSPSIVKRIEPESIRYFRINNSTGISEVHAINLPSKDENIEAYKFVKQAVYIYPELYFARLVILGEGESEEIVLESLFRKAYGSLDSAEISIVPLGGRFVNHLWRLLKGLQIPYITLLDLDVERKGGGWGRIAYILQELENIGVQNPFSVDIEELKNKEIHSIQDLASLKEKVSMLEKYHIYYSSPLDLDFAMLEKNPCLYKSTVGSKQGPRIDVNGKQVLFDKYLKKNDHEDSVIGKRIKEAVRQTLKKEGGDGNSYLSCQKQLMVWYNYLFLGKGKPITHILALANMTKDKVAGCTPDFLNRLEKDALKQLESDIANGK